MNHSDETNKIVGETPISDSTPRNVADFMLFRRLERELNEANEKAQRYYEAILKHKAENEHLTDKIHQLYEGAEEQKQRIKRLLDTGDYLCAAAAFMGWHDKIEDWTKAKEAKL